ncbi:MAG: diguanylate cyclase [Bacilli bacterium]|nr:diguanylate cyclase [Bacilli bacterium]
MNKIVFAYTQESSRSRYLINLLKDDFELILAPSCDAITKLLHESFDSIEALIIDHPSDKPDLDRLFNYVKKHNSFMFTLPIILLTEPSMAADDDKYLSDLVVGMITEGETKRTVLQRIKNTLRFSASMSFDDFSNMLEALPSQIYVKDIKSRYVFCSKRWHHFRKSNESIRGLTDFDIRKNRENAIIAQENDRMVIESGQGTDYIIKECDDEGTEYLQVIKEPIVNKDGKVDGIIAIINNVTDSELLRQELRQKSITDQLTGLFNRFYFEEIVETMKDSLALPLTLVSADCDGLKTINDQFGHAAGDRYICFARDAIQESLPEGSFLFRMGGDEFLAIVPNTDTSSAEELVQRIMKNADGYHTSKFSLKLSAGCYTIKEKGISIEYAVNQSDKAMYRAKQSKK